jgi:hypothetical protein
LAAFWYGTERHSFWAFIALGADKPERQSTGIVRGRPHRLGRSHTKRAFFARLLPPALHHNHSNQHANCLPQSLAASGVYLREESVNRGLRLKFPHNTCQRRAVMMELGFLHSPLAVSIIKELKHGVEWLFRIVDDVGEFLPLSVFQERASCHSDNWHPNLQAVFQCGSVKYKLKTYKYCISNSEICKDGPEHKFSLCLPAHPAEWQTTEERPLTARKWPLTLVDQRCQYPRPNFRDSFPANWNAPGSYDCRILPESATILAAIPVKLAFLSKECLKPPLHFSILEVQ